MRSFRLFALSLLVASATVAPLACSESDAATAEGTDAGADAASSGDAGPRADSGDGSDWEKVETTTDDGTVVIEKVIYRSQGLAIVGQICRPKALGKYRVFVSNHGGFSGIGADWNGGNCKGPAMNGWVVVQSSYRGEDGSEGRVEVCLGEVDDVLAMTKIALTKPYADPSRVAMYGGSHGGCITTRAVQRGAPVQAAIDLFGPTDWTANYSMWRAGLATDAGAGGAFYTVLIDILKTATGGTPEEVPAEYAKRSPIEFMGDLDRFPHPFMALHGTIDPLVLTSDTCRLAKTLPNVRAYHLDNAANVVTTRPLGCENVDADWLPGPRPTPSWPDKRYVLVYDGFGHGFDTVPSQTALADALTFLAAKFP